MISRDVAVVLSGGGAYAAYEVGIMKAILSGETMGTGFLPLEPGIFAGTSAGALNAAVMVSLSANGAVSAIQGLEDIWLNDFAANPAGGGNGVFHFRLDPRHYLDPHTFGANPLATLASLARDSAALSRAFRRHAAEFLFSTGSIESRASGFFDISDFIGSDQLTVTLRRVLDLQNIRSSDRLLRIAATNWSTGEARIFDNEDLSGEEGYAAIRASTAIPGIFPSVEVGGETYVDGGLVMNTPLKPAIDSGAAVVHIVYLDPQIRNIPPVKLESTLSIFERSLAISFADKANQDIAIAAWINAGLRLQRLAAGKTDTPNRTEMALLRKSDDEKARPSRSLTIHRYHPQSDLGGEFGLLDFSRSAVQELLTRGYEDGIRHDCGSSNCVPP